MTDAPLLMIHGGLGEPMDAERFWFRPGVVADLETAGFDVRAPDRSTSPDSWSSSAAEMASLVDEPVTVIAASNGCSVGLRLAIEHPTLVRQLLLLWPATGDDAGVDSVVPPSARHLCTATPIRGVDDGELSQLDRPVAVMASLPANPVHPRRTVDRLLRLVKQAVEIRPGCPEPPSPAFGAHREEFSNALTRYLR